MTAGADGNQPVAIIEARLTMMHMKSVDRAARAALTAVAVQNLIPQTGEAMAGVGGGPIAGVAEVCDSREVPAARAEERPL